MFWRMMPVAHILPYTQLDCSETTNWRVQIKYLIAVTKKGFASLTIVFLRPNLKRVQGKGLGLAVSENKQGKTDKSKT